MFASIGSAVYFVAAVAVARRRRRKVPIDCSVASATVVSAVVWGLVERVARVAMIGMVEKVKVMQRMALEKAPHSTAVAAAAAVSVRTTAVPARSSTDAGVAVRQCRIGWLLVAVVTAAEKHLVLLEAWVAAAASVRFPAAGWTVAVWCRQRRFERRSARRYVGYLNSEMAVWGVVSVAKRRTVVWTAVAVFQEVVVEKMAWASCCRRA
jgi:hypothetical protein